MLTTRKIAIMEKPRSPLLIVALLSLAQLMIVLDFSIVNVALPSIQSQFDLAPTQLQWVVSAYALTFGGFLLLGGRASDIFNRKTVFLAGLVLFSAASLIGGLAGSATLIFISRAVQGLGASMLSPSALSLITTTFSEGSERNRALGVFSSMAALGFTTGVILGGFLTSTLSWHWVFFVNIPIGAFLFVAGLIAIPKLEKNQERRGFDLTGAVLVTTTVLMIIYAVTEISIPGEPLTNIAVLLLLSTALGVSFIVVERRACIPLVPLDIFRRGTISLSDLAMFLTFGANAGLVFIITLFLQEVRGFSPLVTGLIFVPAGLGGITGAVLAPRLIRRIGFRYMMVTGLFLFGASIAGMTTISTTSSIPFLIVLYYVGALGLVSAIVSMNIAGTTGIEQRHQGLAAGLLTTAQQIGAAIGVSVASVVVTTFILSSGAGPASMVASFRASLFVSACLVLAAFLVALYMVRRYALKIKADEREAPNQQVSV